MDVLSTLYMSSLNGILFENDAFSRAVFASTICQAFFSVSSYKRVDNVLDIINDDDVDDDDVDDDDDDGNDDTVKVSLNEQLQQNK